LVTGSDLVGEVGGATPEAVPAPDPPTEAMVRREFLKRGRVDTFAPVRRRAVVRREAIVGGVVILFDCFAVRSRFCDCSLELSESDALQTRYEISMLFEALRRRDRRQWWEERQNGGIRSLMASA